MNVFAGIWQMINGHKFNAGVTITVLAFVFQQIGLGDQATSYATAIVEGIGAVIMVIGFIHKLIKSNQKPAA